MKICVMGVGRSGTTAIYSLLQEILADREGPGGADFFYEPFLWDHSKLNGRYKDVIPHFKSTDSISIKGIYNHLELPLFIENPREFEGNRYLKDIFGNSGGGHGHALAKFIRANGRYRLLRALCPDGKFIFILRNPLDVINSAIIRFSFYGGDFHPDDFGRFRQELLRIHGNAVPAGLSKEPDNRVEKEALYWYHMNRFALESFREADGPGPLVICHEEYAARYEHHVDQICGYLGIPVKDDYYHYAQKIEGSRTATNNLTPAEVEGLAGWMGRYSELLDLAGVGHGTDVDGIMARYRKTAVDNGRAEIMTGMTPNSMNARILQLEGELRQFREKVSMGDPDQCSEELEKSIQIIRELEEELEQNRSDRFMLKELATRTQRGMRSRQREINGLKTDQEGAKKQIDEKDKLLAEREALIIEMSQQIKDSDRRVKDLEATLQRIYRTRWWRLGRVLQKAANTCTGFFKGQKGAPALKLPNRENDERLYRLKDLHKGRRAFLIGNGPSLRVEDLDRLKNEITFASNRIFLCFDQTDWRPTYYTVADHIVAQNNRDLISALELEKIFAVSVWDYFKGGENATFVNPPTPEGEKTWDVVKGIRAGYSVINFDLKLAHWMGIREVYVIGVDFYFEDRSVRTGRHEQGNQVIISTGEQNHFHPDYRKKGETWTIPRLDRQLEDFSRAREMYEASGGQIYNASRRTKLEAWERVELDAIL